MRKSQIAAAVAEALAVVNAASLYVERGSDTFQSVHVNAAERVARLAGGAGAQRFVHVSGIDADARSMSPSEISHRPAHLIAITAFPSSFRAASLIQIEHKIRRALAGVPGAWNWRMLSCSCKRPR